MSDIKIEDLQRQLENIASKSSVKETDEKGIDFSNMLNDALQETNQSKVGAQKRVESYISGENTNLHETLLSLEKAEISFKLMMQVRSKLMSAYKEIMQTGV